MDCCWSSKSPDHVGIAQIAGADFRHVWLRRRRQSVYRCLPEHRRPAPQRSPAQPKRSDNVGGGTVNLAHRQRRAVPGMVFASHSARTRLPGGGFDAGGEGNDGRRELTNIRR